MKYYEDCANTYIEETLKLDMKEQYMFFEKYFDNTTKSILDVGFGSGRDMLYFKSKGYNVKGVDNTLEFVNHAKTLGLDVTYKDIQDLDFENEFDAIWACGSLVHFKPLQLRRALNKCLDALKKNGLMYASFKQGLNSYVSKDGRYFNAFSEAKLRKFLPKTKVKLIELTFTSSVKEDCNDRWINVVFKKIK